MLPPQFEEPAGFQWGEFTSAKGARIRYGTIQPDGAPKGTMVIVGGLREAAEKYFEVIRDMTAKGFAVWIMDWHGQGGSDHYLKNHPHRVYSEGYDEHVETLHQFATTVVEKSNGPLVLTAHSMGGHIALRYLKEHEDVFDSAILTAPMIDIKTGTLPHRVARQVVRFAKAGGYLEKYAPGSTDWDENHDKFKDNNVTSDPVRYGVQPEYFSKKPELRMGGPTYGWVYHTFQSIDVVNNDEYLKSIKTPILMEISGKEMIVDKAAAERAASLLPNCTRVDILDALHEIWMERDELRNRWLKRVSSFLEERLSKHAQTPKKPNLNKVVPPRKLG